MRNDFHEAKCIFQGVRHFLLFSFSDLAVTACSFPVDMRRQNLSLISGRCHKIPLFKTHNFDIQKHFLFLVFNFFFISCSLIIAKGHSYLNKAVTFWRPGLIMEAQKLKNIHTGIIGHVYLYTKKNVYTHIVKFIFSEPLKN